MGLNVMSYINPDKFSGVTHRHERNARLLRATLRKADGTIVPVMVRNLSERGLGLTCKDMPPLQGEVVTIALPGSSEMQGLVRWVRGDSFGMELSGPVDTTNIATAMQRELARAQEASGWEVQSRHRIYTPLANGPRRFV